MAKKTKEPSPDIPEDAPTHCPRHYSQPLDVRVMRGRTLLRCQSCDFTAVS